MSSVYSSGPVYAWVGITQAIANQFAINTDITQGSSAGNQGIQGLPGATAGVAWSVFITRFKQVYLGTGHFAPTQKHRRYFTPVMNDRSGPMKSHDKMYVGQDAMVSMALTDWNEPVYQAIASLPVPGTGFPGVDARGSHGTLMLTEGAAYPLYLRYPNTDFHPAMAAAGQVPGYRYIAAHLEGDDDKESGTKENVRHLLWYCHSVPFADGSHGCYDYNMTGIPAQPPPDAR